MTTHSSGRRNRAHDAGALPRAYAARAISAVLDHGASLDAALARDAPTDADQGLTRALAYGVLRERRRLEAQLAPRLRKQPQPLLKALLLVGLYQLDAMRIPPHAAVHATVAAAPELGFNKARGMVNAVLRGHQRAASADRGEEYSPGVYYSHPDWLVEAIRGDWPDAWQAVLAANNTPAPMHLRVNARQTSAADYWRLLADSGLPAEPTADCRDGLTLAEPIPVRRLPGFAEGRVSVQDGAAQFAADRVDARPGQRVLDAVPHPATRARICVSVPISIYWRWTSTPNAWPASKPISRGSA